MRPGFSGIFATKKCSQLNTKIHKFLSHLQCNWNEMTVPYMTPRPMTKIMAQSSDSYAVDFFVGDSQLWLGFLEMLRHGLREMRDA